MKNNEYMKELLHIVAHDIENACINIEWMGSLLQQSLIQAQDGDQTALNETMPQYIDLIQASSLDVKHKTKGFRHLREWLFYQPQAQQINIYLAIQDVIQALGAMAEKATIHIDMDAHDMLEIDEKAIKQVIQELLSNALHAVDASGGVITISMQQKDQQHILMVEDNGYGISEYDMCHIYDPYFIALPKYECQHDTTSKRHGMGLAIVQAIVHRLNGTTWCQCTEQHVTQCYISLLQRCTKRG